MRILRDFEGRRVRLTAERLAHIYEHPEMRGLLGSIPRTLARPHRVIRSASDPTVRLDYRAPEGTVAGDKLVCIVVRTTSADAFVITAYVTDRVKKGQILWPIEN